MTKPKSRKWPTHQQLVKLGADVLARYIREVWSNELHFSQERQLALLAKVPLELEYERARAAHAKALAAMNRALADDSYNGRIKYWRASDRADKAATRVEAALAALYPPRSTTTTTPPQAEEQSSHGS